MGLGYVNLNISPLTRHGCGSRMGRIRDKVVRLHKKHCLALYLNVFLVLAFIAGYIAFAVTFRTQDRSQVLAALLHSRTLDRTDQTDCRARWPSS